MLRKTTTYIFTREASTHVARYCREKVVCPPVRLSVTLVDCDHVGWNSSKIIPWLGNMRRLLSADPNSIDLFQREHSEILAAIGVGMEKWPSK